MRSVIYLSLFGALPACIMCEMVRIFPTYGQFPITMQFLFGCVIAYRFEKPARHAQLVSFMFPKAMEVLYGFLATKGLFKKRAWHSFVAVLIVMAIIGTSAHVDYKKKLQSAKHISLRTLLSLKPMQSTDSFKLNDDDECFGKKTSEPQ